MKKEIYLKNKIVEYSFEIKNVKNINLRIKSDGSIHVSANQFVPQSVVESFMLSRADFILKAQGKMKNLPKTAPVRYFDEGEICRVILKICYEAYPYFEKKEIKFPQIKFRKMKSRWGSCHTVKGILTFNTNLMYAPPECIEYVVYHEFTHFLHPDHSKLFYAELEKAFPNWKNCRKKLKEVNI